MLYHVAMRQLTGQDQEFVIYGLLACSNAAVLTLVAVLLGWGLAEFPRNLFQSARSKPSLKKAQGRALDNYAAFQDAADNMAKLMCKVLFLVCIYSPYAEMTIMCRVRPECFCGNFRHALKVLVLVNVAMAVVSCCGAFDFCTTNLAAQYD